MRHAALLCASLFLAGLAPATASAQLDVAGHVGTLGIGADVGMRLAPRVGVRARAAVQPWEPSRTVDAVHVTVGFSTLSLQAMVDLHAVGGIRVTGGLLRFQEPITALGRPVGSVEVNGQSYPASDIGTLEVELQTRRTAPYLGIGFGGGTGFGFMIDLGVAFQGAPQVVIDATGALASDPTLRANLDAEARELEGDLEPFRFFPVLQVGMSLGLP